MSSLRALETFPMLAVQGVGEREGPTDFLYPLLAGDLPTNPFAIRAPRGAVAS